MAISVQSAAYAAVVVADVILFAIGTPAERARQMPAIPTPASQSAASPSVASGGGITLRSLSVEFPSSDRGFPGRAAAQAITDNCTACHSPGMVLNQPALTPVRWQAEVNHMRTEFKAPIAAADVPAIVAYLARTKGSK